VKDKSFLEMEGYNILAVNNGRRGLELAAEFIPDLIICDVLMYGMDGYEVLRLLLDSPETHEIPFIFSTSMSEKVEREEAMKLGAADYIIKPFELQALLTMVKACLQSRVKSEDEEIDNSSFSPHLQH
jgi:CheY-like chemotaxis protein